MSNFGISVKNSENPCFVEIAIGGAVASILLEDIAALQQGLRAAFDEGQKRLDDLRGAAAAVRAYHEQDEKVMCIRAVRELSRLRSEDGRAITLILAKDIVEAMWRTPVHGRVA